MPYDATTEISAPEKAVTVNTQPQAKHEMGAIHGKQHCAKEGPASRLRGGGAAKDCFIGLFGCFVCFECCEGCCDCIGDIICCPCEMCC